MKRFKKSYLWIISGIICFVIVIIIGNRWKISRSEEQPKANEQLSELNYSENSEYLVSATYFGDEWPINFWNSEFTNLESDLERIVSDGFNSIILVIPWREFQPSMDPIVYNDRAFEKLKYIMSETEKYNLRVIVRIGYTWDFYEDDLGSVQERFYKVVYDEAVRNSWYDYCRTLYDTCSAFSNYAGGFITWEDFWCNSYLGATLETDEERIKYAQIIGYQDWLKENFEKDDLREYGLELEDISDVRIPCSDDLDMVLWYKYIDEFFVELLLESQNYFPDLSMEVRTDWDVYIDKDGISQWVQHYSTYNCSNSSFTTVMYGIPQGCENKGEKLHYTEAMEKTEYILQGILENNNGKPIYIDQFIFADNTQGFEMNAQLYEDEIDEYLFYIDDILGKYACGYGIWTYRDYAANLLYNSQFAEKESGWNLSKGSIIDDKSNCYVLLLQEGVLSQELPEMRKHYNGDDYIVSFDVEITEPTNVEITLGNTIEWVEVSQNGRFEMTINTKNPFRFSIKTENDIKIDNFKVYNFVQEGLLYDLDGEEGAAIAAMRTLNNNSTN